MTIGLESQAVSERPFFDVSWLAVPGAVTTDLLEALGLSTPIDVTWEQGLSAVLGDYWDFDAPAEASLSRAFTTQGRMDWYAWTAAREGTVVRRLVWTGEPMVDEGSPAPEENWDDEDAFLEDTVCRLASVYAAGPDECDTPLPGLLATTPWGRTHGVPRRPL